MESAKRHKKAGDMLRAALWEEAGQRGIKCYDMPVVVIPKVPEAIPGAQVYVADRKSLGTRPAQQLRLRDIRVALCGVPDECPNGATRV